MFCSKMSAKQIDMVHKGILRTLHREKHMKFTDLLSLDDSHCIHARNLKVLMTEVYKTINNLNPPFMKEIFQIKNSGYNLRNNNLLKVPKTSTVSFGYKSLSVRGAIIWNTLPDEIKNAGNIDLFKKYIKQWDAKTCCCNICR